MDIEKGGFLSGFGGFLSDFASLDILLVVFPTTDAQTRGGPD